MKISQYSCRQSLPSHGLIKYDWDTHDKQLRFTMCWTNTSVQTKPNANTFFATSPCSGMVLHSLQTMHADIAQANHAYIELTVHCLRPCIRSASWPKSSIAALDFITPPVPKALCVALLVKSFIKFELLVAVTVWRGLQPSIIQCFVLRLLQNSIQEPVVDFAVHLLVMCPAWQRQLHWRLIHGQY